MKYLFISESSVVLTAPVLPSLAAEFDANLPFTIWSDDASGDDITALCTLPDGLTALDARTDTLGNIPRFRGPDDVRRVYLDFGGPYRTPVRGVEFDEEIAALIDNPPTGGGTGTLPANLEQWSTDGAAPPKAHKHQNVDFSEFTDVGNSLTKAKDVNTARQYLHALPDTFTGLQLGAKGESGKAMAANESFKASEIAYVPPTGSGITATSVDGAILQASQMGSSNGGVTGVTLDVLWQSGSYPTQPATAPAGIKIRRFTGPEQYLGPTWPGVYDKYEYGQAMVTP